MDEIVFICFHHSVTPELTLFCQLKKNIALEKGVVIVNGIGHWRQNKFMPRKENVYGS